ncbi:ATP-binding protein [Conexibacter sp. CPCC 206217]|uniref:ATP-binding protein n=1 Tax=Conexibacter sp. CPCC 206217 TaxID=3064574 RepID=UPI00271E5F40|nr:ATP-binding protein [Conexibacter sp. CPCC 206217]MDO8213401.1 ATP-binding protein [Conexibacter sp. CPCC 206217]
MARELIDRESEAELLRQAHAQPPSLVVVTGRRRIGKSYLLSTVLNGERVISYHADEQDERGHLDLLADEAAHLLPGAPPLRFADWDAVLQFFALQSYIAPLTVIFDEFQYLCAAQPALPSIIQRHWDNWQRDETPVTLVLSGSALSFMTGLLGHGAPLYGRATQRPFLTALDYRDAAKFVRGTDAEALLRRYAVLGGTPQYQVWAGDRRIETVLRTAVLAKGQPLYEDPLHLLREGEGIRDPATYFAILRAISGGATQHNQIATRIGIPSSNLGARLGRLEELGYVTAWAPLSADGLEPRRTSYRIADPYFGFFFRYVFPNRSRLERGRVEEVAREVLADLDDVMGRAFEDACRTWAGRYAQEDEVGRSDELGSWWSRDGSVEIDVVGTRKGRYSLLGSCKWRRTVGSDVLDALHDAQASLGGKAARARLALFARRGFTPELSARAADEQVLLVTAADLFA